MALEVVTRPSALALLPSGLVPILRSLAPRPIPRINPCTLPTNEQGTSLRRSTNNARLTSMDKCNHGQSPKTPPELNSACIEQTSAPLAAAYLLKVNQS